MTIVGVAGPETNDHAYVEIPSESDEELSFYLPLEDTPMLWKLKQIRSLWKPRLPKIRT